MKQVDFNVRKAALEIEDTELLAKLARGEIIALENNKISLKLPPDAL